jgi:hypothetical protein
VAERVIGVYGISTVTEYEPATDKMKAVSHGNGENGRDFWWWLHGLPFRTSIPERVHIPLDGRRSIWTSDLSVFGILVDDSQNWRDCDALLIEIKLKISCKKPL